MDHRARTLLGGLALAAFATLAGATDLEAQARSFSLGLAAGGSLPLGEIADEYDAGFHVAGLFELASLGSLPIGLRLEGGYQKFTHDDESLTHLFGRVNAVRALGGQGLYLIGGVGLYNSEEDHGGGHHGGLDHDAETFFGFNVGLGRGFALGPLNSFVEARFHTVLDDVHTQFFVPISFGFRF
jgi:hypothetical protein